MKRPIIPRASFTLRQVSQLNALLAVCDDYAGQANLIRKMISALTQQHVPHLSPAGFKHGLPKWEMPKIFPDLNCNAWFCSPSLCAPSVCQPSAGEQQAEVHVAAEPEIAGVGIVFRRVNRASGPVMRVVSLAAGSPAKEETVIEVGSVLTHIDDIPIADKSTYEIGQLILGPVK
jgi:hypothetical protein